VCFSVMCVEYAEYRVQADAHRSRFAFAQVLFTAGSSDIPYFAPHARMRWEALEAVSRHFVGCDAVVRSPVPGLWSEPHPQMGSVAHFRFVLSPPGKGQDTHRTWEALSVGSVPIVTAKSPINAVFSGLPVLQVSRSQSPLAMDGIMTTSTPIRPFHHGYCHRHEPEEGARA
jgi:hypothetical protein